MGATRVVFGVMLCYDSLVFWFEVVVSVLLLCGLVLGIWLWWVWWFSRRGFWGLMMVWLVFRFCGLV